MKYETIRLSAHKKNEGRTRGRCSFSNSSAQQYMRMYKSLNRGTGKGLTFSREHGQTMSFEFPALILFDTKLGRLRRTRRVFWQGLKTCKMHLKKVHFWNAITLQCSKFYKSRDGPLPSTGHSCANTVVQHVSNYLAMNVLHAKLSRVSWAESRKSHTFEM
jgi:hypothetical protein